MEIEAQRKRRPELGEIEIYGSGDELRRIGPSDPDAGPLNLKDREVILVDDVIYTGRTVKSALSIIFRSGRPQSVRLAVLDRPRPPRGAGEAELRRQKYSQLGKRPGARASLRGRRSARSTIKW